MKKILTILLVVGLTFAALFLVNKLTPIITKPVMAQSNVPQMTLVCEARMIDGTVTRIYSYKIPGMRRILYVMMDTKLRSPGTLKIEVGE